MGNYSFMEPLPGIRLYLFYCSYIQPIWQVRSYLGNIMYSLGLTQGALTCFLDLGMWEECVACYNKQGLKHKVNLDLHGLVVIIYS